MSCSIVLLNRETISNCWTINTTSLCMYFFFFKKFLIFVKVFWMICLKIPSQFRFIKRAIHLYVLAQETHSDLFLLFTAVFLKLFSISAPLNNLQTFEGRLRQKVKTLLVNIYLNNVISNSVAFYGMDEAGVL